MKTAVLVLLTVVFSVLFAAGTADLFIPVGVGSVHYAWWADALMAVVGMLGAVTCIHLHRIRKS